MPTKKEDVARTASAQKKQQSNDKTLNVPIKPVNKSRPGSANRKPLYEPRPPAIKRTPQTPK